jgi:hypothetical protein
MSRIRQKNKTVVFNDKLTDRCLICFPVTIRIRVEHRQTPPAPALHGLHPDASGMSGVHNRNDGVQLLKISHFFIDEKGLSSRGGIGQTRCFNSVVFPAPKNPVSTVTGIRLSASSNTGNAFTPWFGWQSRKLLVIFTVK